MPDLRTTVDVKASTNEVIMYVSHRGIRCPVPIRAPKVLGNGGLVPFGRRARAVARAEDARSAA